MLDESKTIKYIPELIEVKELGLLGSLRSRILPD